MFRSKLEVPAINVIRRANVKSWVISKSKITVNGRIYNSKYPCSLPTFTIEPVMAAIPALLYMT